jgi:hypothetical protein
MSKVKNPQEKKANSLQHDRRNSYGESPHGSRKSIPRGKQRGHQLERRAANQILDAVTDAKDDESAEELEGQLKVAVKLANLRAFKKKPDEPLATSIKKKASRR